MQQVRGLAQVRRGGLGAQTHQAPQRRASHRPVAVVKGRRQPASEFGRLGAGRRRRALVALEVQQAAASARGATVKIEDMERCRRSAAGNNVRQHYRPGLAVAE